MRATESPHARCIPHLKRPKFPVEPRAHGLIDGRRVFCGLANTLCSEVPQATTETAIEISPPYLLRDHSPAAASPAPEPSPHSSPSPAKADRLGRRPVFERLEIQHHTKFLAICTPRSSCRSPVGICRPASRASQSPAESAQNPPGVTPCGKFAATCARMSMPTMSASRNVPVRGKPNAGPVSASTSSMLSPCSSISVAALNMTATPMRLPIKFGVSLANTTCLPSTRSANAQRQPPMRHRFRL